jgi:hypothetical protein
MNIKNTFRLNLIFVIVLVILVIIAMLFSD